MTAQPNCESRVDAAMASRVGDLRLMLMPRQEDCTLADDGTLDTVLQLGEVETRYSQDERALYIDEDTEEFDADYFIEEHWGELAEQSYELFYEYGLAFDYVAPETFSDQERGYFRYQISYGGPSEEFRFYVDYGGELSCVEFVYLDWFDGAGRQLTGEDLEVLQAVFELFKECGSLEAEYSKAMEGYYYVWANSIRL